MSGTATDADTLYERAVEKELSGDLDGAFASYVQATQSYLHQSRATKSNAQREKLKSSASRSLERAEKIKAAKRDLQRVKMDTFSSEYQSYVLSRSSSRRGVRIPQWKTLPATDASQSSLFEDPENALFVQSTTSVCSWRRARDVFPDSEMHSTTLEPHDLLQGNPSDCSVIASLAVCLNHHRLFGSYLGLSALYPQDPQGLPIDSPSGMHRAKLLLNGGLREVLIDDLLPIGEHNAPVCAISSGGKALWPTLLEKAYLKSNGGYGFSGSNSCSDVYAVTGWVPELISLTRSTTHRIPLWERLLEGHATGRCVITINTPIEATPFGLIPNHSYAVLKLFTSEGRQMVTLLDSQYTSEPASVKPPLNIDWDDVCDQFSAVSINWDPIRFPNTRLFHFEWPGNAKGQSSNHRYRVHTPTSRPPLTQSESSSLNEVWCLLTRHTRLESDDRCLHR
ncbi:cysteine proteinase [Clavulina sp. PMI_390]|nr:cysteine proteinase [Clavulina sp. PMI_390]